MLGTYALSSGYYDAYYGQAQRVRTKIADDFRTAFEKCDFVVTPTSPTVAFERGARTRTRSRCTSRTTSPCRCRSRASPRSRSRPAWARRSGLPVGFQLAGPAFSETRLLEAAHALERRSGSTGRPPEMMSIEETEVARARGARRAARVGASSEIGEVAVIVEDSHPDGIMGIYDPVGGLERIVIFRDANPNAEEVKRTVYHEIGHHFGMSEEHIDSLGFG